MAITEFSKENLLALREEINSALTALGAKHGIKLHAGNVTYLNDIANFKLEAAIRKPDGTPITKEAADFKRYATQFGFKPEDLGRRFKLGNRPGTYTIVGLMPRSRKRPIVVECNGQRYRIDARSVEIGLIHSEVK